MPHNFKKSHPGQTPAARPPKQSPARVSAPATPPPGPAWTPSGRNLLGLPYPPPGPAWTRSAEVAITREVLAEINGAAARRDALVDWRTLDPASFLYQTAQAYESIRELLDLYDAARDHATRLEQIIAESLHCWKAHSAREAIRALGDAYEAGVSAAETCRRCGAES